MTEDKWNDLLATLRNVDRIDAAVAAAGLLQKNASAEDIPRLITLLADPDFFVREAAAWPLSDLGCVEAIPAMIEAQKAGTAQGHDNDGLSAAMIGLASMHAEASRPVLRPFLDDPEAETREIAQWLWEFVASDA